MADPNRDRNVGGSQQSGGGSPKRDQQSDLDRPERMPEEIKGGQTDRSGSGSEPQRPQRQPGRMPLPD
jgi:hypothetical protein